eukprot:5264726-Pleurochrysis_carterae.AAC.1
MGAVDGKGVMAKKNVQGKWKLSCKNLQRGRRLVKHALEEVRARELQHHTTSCLFALVWPVTAHL